MRRRSRVLTIGFTILTTECPDPLTIGVIVLTTACRDPFAVGFAILAIVCRLLLTMALGRARQRVMAFGLKLAPANHAQSDHCGTAALVVAPCARSATARVVSPGRQDQPVTSAPEIPLRSICFSAPDPNATRSGGAPLLAGCSDPSGRQNLMRSARNRIPRAASQHGSNHAASVLACNSAMPSPWSASFRSRRPPCIDQTAD